MSTYVVRWATKQWQKAWLLCESHDQFLFPAQGQFQDEARKDHDWVNMGFTKIIIQFSNSLKQNFSPVSKVDVDRFYPSDVRLDFPVTQVLIWVKNIT